MRTEYGKIVGITDASEAEAAFIRTKEFINPMNIQMRRQKLYSMRQKSIICPLCHSLPDTKMAAMALV